MFKWINMVVSLWVRLKPFCWCHSGCFYAKKKVFVLVWNCRDVWTEFLTASLLSLNKILKLIFMFYNSRAVLHLYCLVSLWLTVGYKALRHFFFYSFTFNQIAWGHLNLYTSLIFLNKLSATLTLHTDNQGHDTQLIRGLWKQRDCPPLTVILCNENIDHMVESGCAVMVTHFNKMN